MIDGIMRKLGYINEKKLIDVAVHVYESNDEAKAKEIALGQVPNGTITEISFDYENGVLVYEVTVVEGTTEYDFEISGVDGSIISKSMDSTLD